MCIELRESLGTDDIITVVQQNRLRLYGHVEELLSPTPLLVLLRQYI